MRISASNLIILLSILFFFACNNSKRTGFETTKNYTILKCDSLFLKDSWKAKFINAKSKHFELIDTFQRVDAKFRIETNILELDNKNSIVISACVKLIKGASGYEFLGYIHKEPFEEENEGNLKTSTIASIEYVTKEKGTIESEIKEYELFSDGRIVNFKRKTK